MDKVSKACFDLLCGNVIAQGSARTVYECLLGGIEVEAVVKIENTEYKRFQNVLEWELWQSNQYSRLNQWLAPCIDISPCGQILIQQKTEPLTIVEHTLPKRIPAVLTDLKAENFGILHSEDGDLIVCHDYGINLSASGELDLRYKNAKWNL